MGSCIFLILACLCCWLQCPPTEGGNSTIAMLPGGLGIRVVGEVRKATFRLQQVHTWGLSRLLPLLGPELQFASARKPAQIELETPHPPLLLKTQEFAETERHCDLPLVGQPGPQTIIVRFISPLPGRTDWAKAGTQAQEQARGNACFCFLLLQLFKTARLPPPSQGLRATTWQAPRSHVLR